MKHILGILLSFCVTSVIALYYDVAQLNKNYIDLEKRVTALEMKIK